MQDATVASAWMKVLPTHVQKTHVTRTTLSSPVPMLQNSSQIVQPDKRKWKIVIAVSASVLKKAGLARIRLVLKRYVSLENLLMNIATRVFVLMTESPNHALR